MGKEGNYRILIVDDNHNNLFSLGQLIKEYIDAEVLEADCGKDALFILQNASVDLIILDVHMEGMDGFEIASLIKKRNKTKDIPIVFLTAAYKNDEFVKRGFQLGAVDYLVKPIDTYQLINRINVYLNLIEKERNINHVLEQKVKEQTYELRKTMERAEAANEAKSMFLANISHELRTPLNILLSSNQLLNMYLNNDAVIDKKKFQDKICMQRQNCYRLLRLVNNLIDITKIDSGNFKLNFEKCNVVEIIEAVTMSVVDYVTTKEIELIFDTDIEERYLYCDCDAIERIILNLLSNAIKFTPKGGHIYVTINELEDGISISVKDNGIGIPDDKLKLIFERFKQADNLLTRSSEGSGIGLSLVKYLVEMHGGEIKVLSEYQFGSEFIVTLPNINKEEIDEEDQISSEYKINDSVIQKINVEFSDIYI